MLPQYRFEKLLGRGGMGAVYKAVQASLDRAVAIKVLPGDLIGDEDAQFAERFKNEARTMAKMSHPSIVNVFDFGETQSGFLYFVMEFIDGTDVAQMIAAQGRLPEDYALSITAHVCDALAYAHARGVIHRDIKPANILINMEGAVKVADFGLAKQSDSSQSGLTKTNMAMGTPDFVAPEALIPGIPLDGRADLYAIGVMLCQMLSGEIPRGMWTMPGVKLGTDPRFDAIIAKAMQTDREARYQSAAEIRKELDTILALPRSVLIQRQQEAAARAARAQKPAASPVASAKTDEPAPAAKPEKAKSKSKSNGGLWIGLGATAAAAIGVFFIFGDKPKPRPVASSQPQNVKTAKPAPSSPKPATPPAPKPAVVATPPPAAFTEPVPVLGTKAVELLPGIDLGLDAVTGKWTRDGDAVTYSGRKGDWHARLQVPVRPSAGYILDVEVTPSGTSGEVALFLPFAQNGDDELQNILFTIQYGNKEGVRAGFVHFRDQPAFARGTPGWVSLEKPLVGKSLITVQVTQQKPDRLSLKAWLNGSPLLAWEGPRSETSGGSRIWRPANAGHFALGASKDGTIFHRVRIQAIEGEVSWIREPARPTMAAKSPLPAMTPAAPVSQPPAPADPVAVKLASLEKTFLDAYEQQAGAAHKAAVADLNSKYTAALDRSIATASKAGKLDEALALRNEKKLIQNTAAVPDTDGEDTPTSLQTLRKTWRGQMTSLIAKRDQDAAPLHAAYDRALAAYQDELTKAQKLDEASRVKGVREYVASQRESAATPARTSTTVATTSPKAPLGSNGKTPVPTAPTAPPLPADKVLPPLAPATQEEIRALCEWTLSKNGRVTLSMGGNSTGFSKGEALPKGKLTVVGYFVYELSFEPAANEQQWFAILGRLPDLESIFFHKNPGTMPMEMLRGATKLKSLHLTPTGVDDAAFAHLTALKNLESLDITYMVKQFTGAGLGYINENLRHLGTSSPTLTAEGMAYLPRFKKLKSLDLGYDSMDGRGAAFTDAMLAGLAALTELEELNVSNRSLDGSFLAHLPANSKLKHLDLQDVKTFKPEHFKHLARLKNLETLSMPPVEIPPEAASVLAELRGLQEMTLNFNTLFTGESLQNVKGFRSLRELDVNICPISDAGLAAIANAMPELKMFRINREHQSKATLTPEGFSRAFGRLRNLTSVQFAGDKITDEWLPHIAQLKSVDYLMLTGAKITDQGLAPLMKLPLGYLRLDGTPVTDAVIPILKTCPTLSNVPVGDTKMTDAGKAELRKMLESR